MFARLMIVLALLALPGTAYAQWKRATSDNFVVYSDGNEQSLRQFTAKVEAFDALLRYASGIKAPPAPKRLEIYLLRDANQVGRLLGKAGRDVAGFYSPQLAGAIAVVPRTGKGDKFDLDGETVLFHEYAHHFMKQYFPSAYPPWYVEGFAEFYSTAEVDDQGVASIGKPAYHRAYGLVLSTPFPIARLLSDRPAAKGGEEGDAYYGRSWLLAHMLTFSNNRKGQLAAYLAAFAGGTPAIKAATDAFGPLPALEKDLVAYVKGRLSYRKIAGLDIKAANITVAMLDPAQSALLIDRLNLLTEVTEDERPRFLASVRKIAVRFPDNPYALEMLAEAALMEDKRTEAAALNDRLIALKPDYAPALLRKAQMMADEADKTENRETHWKAVRALIVRANRVDNDDTTALFRYYESFLREGAVPSGVAVDGLMRTFQLAPQLGLVRIAVAQQLLRDKQPKAARAVLMPIAYAPHGEEDSVIARSMIDAIDGKTGTAPAQNDKPDDNALKSDTAAPSS